MIVSIHKSSGRIIVAVCDSELLGKTFSKGDLQLDLASDFYKGEEKTPEETLQIMKAAHMLNLVGEKTINLAIANGFISKEHVLYVEKIPHAQMVLM